MVTPSNLPSAPGFEFVFHVGYAQREYNIREVTAEYREGAPCSARTGERGSISLLDHKKPRVPARKRECTFREANCSSIFASRAKNENQNLGAKQRIPTFACSAGRTWGTRLQIHLHLRWRSPHIQKPRIPTFARSRRTSGTPSKVQFKTPPKLLPPAYVPRLSSILSAFDLPLFLSTVTRTDLELWSSLLAITW